MEGVFGHTAPADPSLTLGMTRFDVAWQRLANQFLLTRPFTSAAAVVKKLGAVQAQDYAGAKWALALRMKKPTPESIEGAMTRGDFIRTHVLRPTWHLVAAGDLRWMLALTAPLISARMKTYNKTMGITPAMFARSNDAIARALEGGKQLTRQELAAEIRRAGVKILSVQHLAHLMMQAELDGVVCSGALREKQFTYALIDERVPAAKPRDRDEAVLRLTRLYFASRSPATAQDFSWWSELSVGDAKRGIEMAKLKTITVDGRIYFTPGSRVPSRRTGPVAHLLPNYDEFFIGFRDRGAIARRLGSATLVSGGDALIAHVIVVDGQLVGGWKRVARGKRTTVELRLVTPVKPNERKAIAAAADDYAGFLGPAAGVAFV